ncbi:MAG: phosphoglycerate kinase [Bacilli bacterium]
MKKLLRNINVKEKKVLLRCDFNVPIENGKIIDDSKIIASLDTIRYLIQQGSRIIILSHLGKVTNEADKAKNTLEPVARYLKEKLNTRVVFSKQYMSLAIEQTVKELIPGDILLLENTRHADFPDKLESNNDPELAAFWSSLADVFVMDAFGSAHRRHASTYGVAKLLPNCIGFLVEKELLFLEKYVLNPEKPFTVLMGGAKIDDKLKIMEKLLPLCDHLLLTGCLANTCLNVLGFNVGASLVSKDQEVIGKVKKMLVNYKNKIMLPLDVIVTKKYKSDIVKHVNLVEIDSDDIIYDIGIKTIDKFTETINNSKTIFINGTAGKYEDIRFANGTRELLDRITKSKAIKIAGGGDGVSAIKKFKFENKFDYLSTGGGATLEYIENGNLSALDAIEEEKVYEVLDL